MFTAREGGSQGGRTKKHEPKGRRTSDWHLRIRDSYGTQDLRPGPTDAPRDRLKFVVGPLRPVGSESVALTQGTRTPATTNLATRHQQCGGPTPTRRFGKCGPDGGEHEPPPPRADRGEALGRCPRRWTTWREYEPTRPQGQGGGGGGGTLQVILRDGVMSNAHACWCCVA